MTDRTQILEKLKAAHLKSRGEADKKWESPPPGAPGDLSSDTGLSNDAVDGIAAIILILIFVAGMAYWLQGMP